MSVLRAEDIEIYVNISIHIYIPSVAVSRQHVLQKNPDPLSEVPYSLKCTYECIYIYEYLYF
jgi:hypothetical protein